MSEPHLKRILAEYVEYYNQSRTRLSLEMDSPSIRPVQTPDQGRTIALPQVRTPRSVVLTTVFFSPFRAILAGELCLVVQYPELTRPKSRQ